ncbi:MAG TPA: hypothetical protein VFA93_02985 [Patescibacteria group bacterium]|nr:hypothetical protein [Patescibacteria group bacterium]
MPDKSNTANQQLDKTLIRSKLDEERRQGNKAEQKIKEEEKNHKK